MVIGITGNSGSGKSEISKMLAKRIKAKIIDADSIVRTLSEPGNKYYEKIVELFGKEILQGEKLNKKKLAEIIYSDQIKIEKLNNLTYKYVVEKIKAEVESIKTKNVIIDAPLLFESGLDKICEFTIAVLVDREKKVERICNRDKISKKTAIARLNIQADDNFYTKKADYIIVNNGKIEEINMEEICIKIGMN